MTSKTIIIVDDYLHRTAEILRKYGSFIEHTGLSDGKMGIMLFLYRYSRYSNNSLYASYADELLDEILESLHTDLPLYIETGFCGIGFGIEYIIQNKYIEAESEEILQNIDSHINNSFIQDEINDFELLHSVALYWIQRAKDVEFNTVIDKYNRLLSPAIAGQVDHIRPYQSVMSLLLLYCRSDKHDTDRINLLLDWMLAHNDEKPQLHKTGCDKYLKNYLHGWFSRDENDYREDGSALPDGLTLNDLLRLSWYKLLYQIEMPKDLLYNKINRVVSETTLLEEFILLANLSTMGLNSNMTGMAWALLDYMEYEDVT